MLFILFLSIELDFVFFAKQSLCTQMTIKVLFKSRSHYVQIASTLD